MELIHRQSLRLRGATRIESDLFTANDYALITRRVKKIMVNNLLIITTDENISVFVYFSDFITSEYMSQ